MSTEELDNIKERIQVKKEQLSRGQLEIPEDKELVKESIEERMEGSLKELPPGMEEIGPGMEKKIPSPDDLYIGEKISPDEIMEEAQIKLSELITIALEESIPQAVTTALKTGNAFLIDKLRDSLVDRYYEKLKEKNLI
ncbi:MAG: hypothetical protein WC320_00900 [Candidatus Paceibacterota bacterium]|jgi:hypothetical protein